MKRFDQINHQVLSNNDLDIHTLDFKLPEELAAGEPPEARGLYRDEVRLMVSHYTNDQMIHTKFHRFPGFLDADDVVVINTSGTMNAAIKATRHDGMPLELHLSTQLPSREWVVEIRKPTGISTAPFYNITTSEILDLPEGGSVKILAPYRRIPQNVLIEKKDKENHTQNVQEKGARLWRVTLNLPYPLKEYLSLYGFPIRYDYVKRSWPSSYYQTVYSTEIGSAEMPSAGRAFTLRLLKRLKIQGIQIAPLILHTGVASLESHEPPYEEYYRVPAETADIINIAKDRGNRVVAVGTTVIRALETVTDKTGAIYSGEGWTDLIVTPASGIHSVNALLTGFHEPYATHLSMLEALTGSKHLRTTYTEALRKGYLWHEFGDLHLILP